MALWRAIVEEFDDVFQVVLSVYYINIGMKCDVLLQRIKQFHGDGAGLLSLRP